MKGILRTFRSAKKIFFGPPLALEKWGRGRGSFGPIRSLQTRKKKFWVQKIAILGRNVSRRGPLYRSEDDKCQVFKGPRGVKMCKNCRKLKFNISEETDYRSKNYFFRAF